MAQELEQVSDEQIWIPVGRSFECLIKRYTVKPSGESVGMAMEVAQGTSPELSPYYQRRIKEKTGEELDD